MENSTEETMGESQEATQYNYKEIQKNLNDLLNQVEDIKGDISKEKENIKGIEDKFENVTDKIVTAKQMLEEPSGIKPKCTIKSLCEEFAIIFQNKTKERKKTKEKSAYLSAENIYDEFRKESGAMLAPFSRLLKLMIFFYLVSVFVFGVVSSLLCSQSSIQHIPPCLKMIIPFLEPIVLLGVFLKFCDAFDNKIEVLFPIFVLMLWFVVVCVVQGFSFKFLFLISHFFLSIYFVSIIEYNSKNYSDDKIKEAIIQIEEILSGHNFKNNEEYIYGLLVEYSTSIEDIVVLLVKKLVNFITVSGFVIAIIFNDKIEQVKNIFDIGGLLKGQDPVLVTTMQIWTVDLLLTIVVLLFLWYKCFNWKADFYREVLKYKQFSLAKR